MKKGLFFETIMGQNVPIFYLQKKWFFLDSIRDIYVSFF